MSAAPQGRRLAGFVSYAHDDIATLQALQTDLKVTERVYGLSFWADPHIRAGQRWRGEIQRAVDAAQVFLLLVSRAYLASDFINDHEWPAILRRMQAPETTLAIAVILEPSGWQAQFGESQVVPTIDGRVRPLVHWDRPADGYNHVREQIEDSLREHFGLTPQIRGTANPLKALGQDPEGLRWRQHGDQFAQDTGGGWHDAQAAADPQVAQLQAHVARQAARFAATAERLGNRPGWTRIPDDARRLAAAASVAPADLPGQIGAVYPAIAVVASYLALDQSLRDGAASDAEPLDPEIARELGALVDIAAIWIRQFPIAQQFDEALLRSRDAARHTAQAAAIVRGARTRRVVSDADAARVASLLDAEGRGAAGAKAALHGEVGVRNLIYRGGGLLTEEALARRDAPGHPASPLARRVRDLLAAEGPEVAALVADLPPEVRHAIVRLLAGDLAEPESAAEAVAGAAKPPWADDAGTDRYGSWASFRVTGTDGARVIQRMRWIPPGQFMMGSPEDEAGRYDDEGPRHAVTIAEGFWLFDTACTEALWRAVTEQPSRLVRGAEFPVTEVSWEDAREFVARLNAARPSLALGLPSEARWEYACRAGTQTPYSFGREINRERVCYASEVPVPVGALRPNQWGLYEMHGNVWEWCADEWHRNYNGAPDDGSPWIDRPRAADRVIRGGSWGGVARGVRAARRGGAHGAHRDDGLGFRCARVQDSG